jgi:hypothetical protein
LEARGEIVFDDPPVGSLPAAPLIGFIESDAELRPVVVHMI